MNDTTKEYNGRNTQIKRAAPYSWEGVGIW